MNSDLALTRHIPEPSLKRLPVYLQLLKSAVENLEMEISTTKIANELNLDPTQVRKDLAYTGIIGKPKIGYDIQELIDAIESFLNWNNKTDAFLVGAGNLGSALIGYEQLKKFGISIIAAFDNDVRKTGKNIKDVPVFPMNKLIDLAKRMHINIGIISVPAEAAQYAANLLIEGGIKAIWNFSSSKLKAKPPAISIPESIKSFAVLSKVYKS